MSARIGLAGLWLLTACGASTEDPSVRAAHTVGAMAPPVFLVPETPSALVGQPAHFELRTGSLDRPAAVSSSLGRLDPCMARVGGTQHNELSLDTGSSSRLSHVFDQPGDAMVGFSTEARPSGRSTPAGHEILVTEHVKALLFVSRDGRDRPSPSAAMSHRLGLELEIVPLTDPLPLLPGDYLPLRVRFHGPGLEAAEVVVQRESRGDVVEHFRGSTDSVGSVAMVIGDPGRYLVSVVHQESETRWHRAALAFDVGAKR